MKQLDLELIQDYDWRLGELASLKSFPFRYKLRDQDKDMIFKYSIPALYAIWEGFVVNSFTLAIREINNKALKFHELHEKILCHAVDSEDKLSLNRARTDFKIKQEFVVAFLDFTNQEIKINSKIPTNSNIDFKTINDLLNRFNFDMIPEKDFKTRLNKLVLFRNAVAHGDNSIPITKENVEEFGKTVVEVMSNLLNIIIDGLKRECYRM